ncbi:hypothetical protein VTL71DRAFT_10877 [Oculimacula yallundae]|uniref:Uncharacterized protein n=1 Tax=Oculimacula yallundae TaxID=86028 RepID=A0ABR4CVR3_9HELO
MSTKAANGSSSSSRSKKSSSAKHSSNLKSTSSKSPQSIPHTNAQENNSYSKSIGRSSKTRKSTPSERIVNYISDPEYSNPGYGPAYTNALAYTYGFPEELEARTEMEQEMMKESQERALARINKYDRMMEYEQRRK